MLCVVFSHVVHVYGVLWCGDMSYLIVVWCGFVSAVRSTNQTMRSGDYITPHRTDEMR